MKRRKWWHKAISEGESLGARPQLARIYAEMGMRLYETKNTSAGADEIRVKELLKKAKMMFSDLGLHHDLDDLNAFITQTGLEISDK
jgi:hypothetical protein